VLFDEKMNSFSVIRKKTPFQKHREEEEAKKKVHMSLNLTFSHEGNIICLVVYS
ncbi:hypothetical protein KI387_042416, partial [Taxus chinensis]